MSMDCTCEKRLSSLLAQLSALPALQPWLVSAIQAAVRESALLHRNGAEQAAHARVSLLEDLIVAAERWFNEEIGVAEAAVATGKCEETVRRKVRNREVSGRRTRGGGRIRIRRGDLLALEGSSGNAYDPTIDAQDIATLRRLK